MCKMKIQINLKLELNRNTKVRKYLWFRSGKKATKRTQIVIKLADRSNGFDLNLANVSLWSETSSKYKITANPAHIIDYFKRLIEINIPPHRCVDNSRTCNYYRQMNLQWFHSYYSHDRANITKSGVWLNDWTWSLFATEFATDQKQKPMWNLKPKMEEKWFLTW